MKKVTLFIILALVYTITNAQEHRLYAWGVNYNTLGNGTAQDEHAPAAIGSSDWKMIGTAGWQHVIAIKKDGTLWAWGDNTYHELGDADASGLSSSSPVQIGTGHTWSYCSAGFLTSGAIATDGTLWMWGGDGDGQLGNGSSVPNSYSNVPIQVGSDNHWAKLSVSSRSSTYCHVLAIKSDGTLWAWGNDGNGEVGVGTQNDVYSTPQKIGTGTNWAQISTGHNHSAAIKSDGTLWIWGGNGNGELGMPAVSISQLTPVQLESDTWKAISAGSGYTVGIHSDGSLWAWGINDHGQLGDGTTTNRSQPVRIGTANDWVGISAGSDHTLAIKTNGTLWAWGDNENGEVGNNNSGTGVMQTSPIKIGTDTSWASVVAGDGYSFGLKKHYTSTGIQELSADDGNITAYPNPSNGVFNILINMKKPSNTYTLLLTDICGRNMVNQKITATGNATNIRMNISDKAAGTYFLLVITDKGTKTMKLVVN